MRLRMLTVAIASLLPVVLLGPLPAQANPTAPATPAMSPTSPPSSAAPSPGSKTTKVATTLGNDTACVVLAKKTTAGQWVCSGDSSLTYTDAKGKRVTKVVPGAASSVQDLRVSAGARSRAAGAAPAVVTPNAVGDDWDGWCEPTGKCTRVLTDFIAETKSNDYYGIGDETYGSFDEIWRQSFNGMKNRYRLALIWDLGYEVDPLKFHADVRYYKVGPDGYAGEATLKPGAVSVYAQEAIYPGKKTFTQVSKNAHNRTTTHHDDLYGDFDAADRYWYTTTTGFPSFKCPKAQCRYK